MPSMRLICSCVSTSSFLNRSVCHHLKPKPCDCAIEGVAAASTIKDKTRQMNNLRRVFILCMPYDHMEAGVYEKGLQTDRWLTGNHAPRLGWQSQRFERGLARVGEGE